MSRLSPHQETLCVVILEQFLMLSNKFFVVRSLIISVKSVKSTPMELSLENSDPSGVAIILWDYVIRIQDGYQTCGRPSSSLVCGGKGRFLKNILLYSFKSLSNLRMNEPLTNLVLKIMGCQIAVGHFSACLGRSYLILIFSQ